MFVDRQPELAFLQRILQRQIPGPGQLILLYGRRRVGKTALLRMWAEQSGLPFTYWVAAKEPAPLQRRMLMAAILESLGQAMPPPDFDSWTTLWKGLATLIGQQRHLLILDELPYAVESDPALLSSLQHAWDQFFQHAQMIIVLCGSHVHTMESLLSRQSPLFGRMTGQWLLQPLPFGAVQQFFPGWAADERVAVYGMLGGIPAYLSWFDATQTLMHNLRSVLLAPGSLALAEADFLLHEEVREPRNYLAILQALGAGHHELKAISDASMIATPHATAYLSQLQTLRLVERRLPATIPPGLQGHSRKGRYHLNDPFLRFYFRFLAPFARSGTLSYQPERLLPGLQAGLRAFLGGTAWESLSQQWIMTPQGLATLGWLPEIVGSHWSRSEQIDVVAINWQEKRLLLGECKWMTEPMDRALVRDLLTRGARVVAAIPHGGAGWKTTYACFARSGLTPAAATTLRDHGGIAIDLATLDTAFTEALDQRIEGQDHTS